ncbi:MAG: tetratricopeptide repeat protein [Anaerolineales bacterium]|nr:tetratricopeptide repeat protein [Anaerolineales bacterium]MCB0028739.1 tetratricopeptide repeat protein [Anaerolineales bacterium]
MSDELKEQGLALFRRGEYDQALTVFQEAAGSYEVAGEPAGRGEMLNNCGVIYRYLRQWDKGITILDEAKALFTELGDQQRLGQTLGNLAMLQAGQGQADLAMSSYGASAAAFAADGDGAKQSEMLRALSLLQLRKGLWLPAILTMQESAAVHPHPSVGQHFIRLLFGWANRLLGGRQ